ncbi:putative protein N(5)-glutamine methyltransferase [Nocardia higoensis]|uniref:peptide chain release factor N(5)-glutamine methyltransferase n=1 Tax=Nocardia higoensis TaxID=228599 RepID=A0ABS0D6W3_9NOCA|nr:putative protein N(5)-glutamine methyltransferase [Nocardia higoensis]MBF6354211.1 putative protein N(5)-glutamine methyltransferase [Nocardia higoensis]
MHRVLADLTVRLRAAGCVFAEEEAALLARAAAASGVSLDELVERRVAGSPLEHVLGWVEFDGLRIAVEPGVFVPRQRTVLLVETAVAAAVDRPGVVRVVDLCCGCGALGLAFAVRMRALGREVELLAADVDATAVRCARGNLADHGTVVAGDLFDALPREWRGRIDILLANVPYVPTGAIADMPSEARDHEPHVALDGGPDGLTVLRRVAEGAPPWLAPGGAVLCETSRDQTPHAVAAFAEHGLSARRIESEPLFATAVIGRRQTS